MLTLGRFKNINPFQTGKALDKLQKIAGPLFKNFVALCGSSDIRSLYDLSVFGLLKPDISDDDINRLYSELHGVFLTVPVLDLKPGEDLGTITFRDFYREYSGIGSVEELKAALYKCGSLPEYRNLLLQMTKCPKDIVKEYPEINAFFVNLDNPSDEALAAAGRIIRYFKTPGLEVEGLTCVYKNNSGETEMLIPVESGLTAGVEKPILRLDDDYGSGLKTAVLDTETYPDCRIHLVKISVKSGTGEN